MLIFLILCGVAAAETAQQTSLSALSQTSSICIDPPPQSGNATLDAVVARAIETLAALPGGTVANGSSSAPNA